jgi:hypothetical protein
MAGPNHALHATHRLFPSGLVSSPTATGLRRLAAGLTRFERAGFLAIILWKNLSAVLPSSAVCASGGIPPGGYYGLPGKKSLPFFSKTGPGAYADLEIRGGKATGNTRK